MVNGAKDGQDPNQRKIKYAFDIVTTGQKAVSTSPSNVHPLSRSLDPWTAMTFDGDHPDLLVHITTGTIQKTFLVGKICGILYTLHA